MEGRSYPIPIPYRLKNNSIVRDIYTIKYVDYEKDVRFMRMNNEPMNYFKDYSWVMYDNYKFYKNIYKYGIMKYNNDDYVFANDVYELTIKWNDTYNIDDEFTEVGIYDVKKVTITTVIDEIVNFYEDFYIYPDCTKCSFKNIYYNDDKKEISVEFEIK